jgi:hypothetical protein
MLLFCSALLADDVLVQNFFDIRRLRYAGLGLEGLLLVGLFRDDVVAQLDAFVADIDRRAGDQLLDLPLGLAAEGTAQIG